MELFTLGQALLGVFIICMAIAGVTEWLDINK